MRLNRLFIGIYLVCCLQISLLAQQLTDRYIYRYYNSNQGLSNNSIFSILQDYKGYIWVATQDGLNRFDGKSFKTYRNNVNDKNSLSNNYIICIFEDRDSTLWIGTRGGGLSKFNRANDNFTNYFYQANNTSSISHAEVSSIYEDNQNNLWIGTDGGGLNLFNRQSEKFTRFDNKTTNSDEPNPLKILAINGDDHDNLLIGTWDYGLLIFNIKSKKFSHLNNAGVKNGHTFDRIWTIKKDRLGNFFLGLFEGGFQYFDYSKKQFSCLQSEFNKLYGKSSIYSFCEISNNELLIGTDIGIFIVSIKYNKKGFYLTKDIEKLNSYFSISVMKDKSGNIWSTDYLRGLVQLIPVDKQFLVQAVAIGSSGEQANQLQITSFTETENGQIIFGTEVGIFLFDSKTRTFKKLEKFLDPNILKQRITELNFYNNTIWSSRIYDISWFNKRTGKFDTFFSIPHDIFNSNRNGFTDFLFKNNIGWFASENGLYKVDLQSRKMNTIIDPKETENGFNIFSVRSIADDNNGNILMATFGGGLIVYNTITDQKTLYQHDPNNPLSISSNYINQVIVSKQGKIWLCTFNGLEEFDKKTGVFKHYNALNGFPANLMNSVVEDDRGNLWISTQISISKFNPATGKTWKFNFYNQGSQNVFIIRSAYKATNGYLYFGRIGSFVFFHPDSIKENTKGPLIYLTDFKINYQSVSVGVNSRLKKNIEDAKEVVLKHSQSSFSFTFAAINYSYPEKVQYAYMLKNFDKDWINAGNQSIANYTNIPLGNYVFKVKASNENGIWNNDGVSIRVRILPAFWETWYFKVALSFFIILTGFILIVNKIGHIKAEKLKMEKMVVERTSQLIEKNTILEEQKEEIEQQKEEIKTHHDDLAHHKDHLEIMISVRTIELEKALIKAKESDALKSSFLANMSHEIRTPLNAIVGFSTLLNSEELTSEKRETFTSIIQSNSDALLVLIDDILDLSKIEAGQIDIQLSTIKADSFTKQIFETFGQSKTQQNVEIMINPLAANNDYYIQADPYRLKQIFNNLLSNAIKFTNQGFIEIGVLPPENRHFTFYVKDTGIGISPENHKIVFDRFRKVESISNTLYGGTGLGLAITKRLIELLGGKIWVESAINTGSTFYFTIPLAEIPKNENNETTPTNIKPSDIKINTILIVEDNEANYIYLFELLKDFKIKILWARDGNEAVDITRKNADIALILMDIKLPGISGTEALKKIRKFNSTVPVIAQTAFALNEEKNEFMESGFTGYISKPIKKSELWAVLKNYLST